MDHLILANQRQSLLVVIVPPGTPHRWWNETEEDAHVLAELRPALNTEMFFETAYGPIWASLAWTLVLWLICLWMYRRKIFLKV